MVARRSANFDPNVDPELLDLFQRVAAAYGPYDVEAFSGYRPHPSLKGSQHGIAGRGAIDFNLIDRNTGKALPNYQNAQSAGDYQGFANALYAAASPEMKAKLRWGGYFGGGSDPLDLMHIDIGGGPNGLAMAGGSWGGGFNPEMMGRWGIKNAGGVDATGAAAPSVAGAMGPAMPTGNRMDFTPEQRRNAIASIESAGSGDYGALGTWIGDPESGRDRAYGRYQMMGKNIPVWTKQVLGRAMTPDEFLANTQAQDVVFDKIFGEYVQKYGENGAANMWFTGHPEDTGRVDPNGMSDTNYSAKYLKALGAPAQNLGAWPKVLTPPAASGAPGTTQTPTEIAASNARKAQNDADTNKAIASGLGGLFGGTASGAQQSLGMPQISMAKPMATPVQAPVAPFINPQTAQASRNQLALAMQRLNTGKLF